MPELFKKLALAAVCVAIVTSVSSCGRKGDLDAPGTYEGQPMDKATGTVKTKPLPKEDKPFILDPLL
ncbi:lipoprotein [Rhizobium sp. C4]|uniref:lipoprotein n=1 Tax=Rhizobium sp. C4 TaxID=1349800 RepID=UPI001E3621DC|nr:lipoprotein [Rhizobium sp. C4]MCD2175697.1 lipoprotein [Rhizobium sp. C4]